MLDKDILELRDHLRSELLLLQVIATLYDTADEAKVLFIFKTTIFIILCDFHANLIEGFLSK